ncbi:tetratricopeptide repeat protein [Halobacteriovorax sp. ZH5_bin.2]|uniref:tetratricopeptide repeat protein n=1 Tax=unclassified Halobacteriovorax TaxID=2639665 RepID=UPI003716D26C
MKYLAILSMLLIVSCASSKKGTTQQLEDGEQIENLTNADFKPKSQIRYNAEADYHLINDLVDDVLEDESLDKVKLDKLEEIDSKKTGLVGLCYMGNTKEGLSQLDQMYEKYKANPSYWNQQGICSYKSGNKRLAKVYFNKAVALDDKYIPAINNIGVVYVDEDKDAKAIAAFKQVLILKKNNKTAMFNLANIYIRYGLYSKSISLLKRLYSVNKNDRDVINSLVYSYLFDVKPKYAYTILKEMNSDYIDIPSLKIALYYSLKQLKSEHATTIQSDLDTTDMNAKDKAFYQQVRKM